MSARHRTRIAWILSIFALLPVNVHAQEAPRTLFESGYEAWDLGDYPAAIRAYQEVLDAPGGDVYFNEIALVTGELFTTVELAPDGTAPRWSSDGRHLTFEVSKGNGWQTHVMRIEDAREVATLAGRNATVVDGQRLVFLRLNEGPELDAAREAARPAEPPRTRAAFVEMREALMAVDARFTDVVVADLASGNETVVPTPLLDVYEMIPTAAGEAFFVVAGQNGSRERKDIYELDSDGTARLLTDFPGLKSNLQILVDSKHAIYQVDGASFDVLNLETGLRTQFDGIAPVASADGSTIAYLKPRQNLNTIQRLRIGEDPREIFVTESSIENLALSPDGRQVAFQIMPRENWELMAATADSSWQITHKIQHDLFPRYIDDETIFAVIGEGRHRRSYLHDVKTGRRRRVFHNNTIRTVAPEYEWAVSPDGSKVAIVAERDGDTISPERGVYLVDLTKKITRKELSARLEANLRSEELLREKGLAIFEPVEEAVREAVADVSTTRIYGYERDLFAFGSKYITEPGNARAIAYLVDRLRAFGYEPELQWFEPRPGIRTANVIATLKGTRHPELIYAVSSHFDSVQRGPGADDNTSGTTALLEAARVLASRPQPATIQFAFFTGEEAGLLGSRHFVSVAVQRGDRLVGALNNDMIGYANDNRLDNTIRYSNDGIRDIQHAAAFLFTDLITYDARYYKNTDAHAYYEAYGDIVGGIGSYPILGNPHYHQSHDVLETINHQLVAEVSKTTVATLMLLASSPSRLKNLQVERAGGRAEVTWAPALESDVKSYRVDYGPAGGEIRTIETEESKVTLRQVESGWMVAVKAINKDEMESWDWARAVIE